MSQDPFFSQEYSQPLLLNPSLSGVYQGSYKITATYRNHWNSVIGQAFSTFAASGDIRFEIDRNFRNKDIVSAGIVALTDNTPAFDLNTRFMAVRGAYHKGLSGERISYLSAGVGFGANQRSIGYDDFFFHDQFDGIGGYTRPTREVLPNNNFAFLDLMGGVSFTQEIYDNAIFNIGIAANHLFEPNYSFYQDESGVEVEIPLYTRINIHTSAMLPFNRSFALIPRITTTLQGPYNRLDAMVSAKFSSPHREGRAFYIGAGGRANTDIDSYRFSAVTTMVGVEVSALVLGLTYDFYTPTDVIGFAERTSWELSLSYIGNYQNDQTFCPKF